MGEVKVEHPTETSRANLLDTRARLLPFAFTFGLAGLTLLPQVRRNPKVLTAFLGVAILLCLWNALLLFRARRTGRTLQLEVVLRKQHYVQACAQLAVLLYWGWYWPPVYAFGPFILAQLLFAYAFDMLLAGPGATLTRSGLGVSSHLQHQFVSVVQIGLVLSAVRYGGARVAAKELIRWNRDGRRVHIFNPSSFPLAVFSLALLATGRSDLTWGQNIATTQFYPPQMYLMLFLIGLPGQFFFGVTSMTMSAVVAEYAFGRIYFAADRHLFFLRFLHPDCRFSGDASVIQRSVDLASNRVGAHHLWGDLRIEHGCCIGCWAAPVCRRSMTSYSKSRC